MIGLGHAGICGARAAAAPAGTTILLLHAEQADNSTAIVDSAGQGAIITRSLTTNIAGGLIGAGCIQVAAGGSITASNLLFDKAKIAIEFYCYTTDTTNANILLQVGSTPNGDISSEYLALQRTASNTLTVGFGTLSFTTTANQPHLYGYSLNVETGDCSIYLDGVLKGVRNLLAYFTTPITDTKLQISLATGSPAPTVYVDEVRVRKGVLITAGMPTLPFSA